MASYYYKYQFVSPDPLYARVREEFKSYFDTGAIDDLLFPVWTDKCLRRLGRAVFVIEHAVLHMCDFECKLPPDFRWVREAWLTTNVLPISHQKPGAYYQQITTALNPDFVPDDSGFCYNTCNPEYVNLTYKTTTWEKENQLTLKYLLKPGNVNAREHCAPECPNLLTDNQLVDSFSIANPEVFSTQDSFDIAGNKFRTNFREGIVYLIYYSDEPNQQGYQLIPDNYRIQEFIEAFIKQKVIEQLYNQIVDETFNQIERKYTIYKQQADEAYILADIEIKKETVYDKMRAIYRDRHSLDQYIVNMYGDPRGIRGFGGIGNRHRRRFF